MSWQTIVTKNAIVNGTFSLIKGKSKYVLPRAPFEDSLLEDSVLIKMVYRRLFRLQPLISQRKMVRDTYTEYLRNKFKKEDYILKRSIVFCESYQSTLREDLWNTFIFVLKSTCYLPETEELKYDVARDNTTCRQILKNILTMEFQKNRLIYEGKTKKGTNYSKIRESYEYLNLESQSDPRFMVIAKFDRYLLYLNEMLGTRL